MNEIEHKVFSCKRCQKKLRVPIKAGKKLLVDCPSCGQENQISFQGLIWTLTSNKRNRLLTIIVGLALVLVLFGLVLGQMHSKGIQDLDNREQNSQENVPLKII
jgi:DNA-directed RNA polymerase subunit RPC12/RpoP